MNITEFKIGSSFYCGNHEWRCTDIGTRVVTAINISEKLDVSWFKGPGYAVEEIVFDEEDQKGCTLIQPSHLKTVLLENI
jgi:hypothetical protein